MSIEVDLREVLEAYPPACQPTAIESLGSAGGFSGARLWRLQTRRGTLCLRRWPLEHPGSKKLIFMHAVLKHVWQTGFQLVPAPIIPWYTEHPQQQLTHIRAGGHLWELTPWMPGVADYRQAPSEAKLTAAMKALAGFHRAAETFPKTKSALVNSPGISDRMVRLRQLVAGGFDELKQRIEPGGWPEFALLARQMAELFSKHSAQILSRLTTACRLQVPLQPCIRDIWHQHVLFEGEQVSGLIDFGAMRVESVATDIARLLGSMVGNDRQGWQRGLDDYSQLRPLSDAELQLIRVYDVSGLFLGGINWIQWVYLEEREFENRGAVLERLRELIGRLETVQI